MLTPARIIEKKRDGGELSQEELEFFIAGVLSGDFADYQSSALLMAIYFNDMSLNETVWLTQAMIKHSDRYELSSVPDPKIDKHSTGGVGDKVSLVLAPLAAACGLHVPMVSGRGLGHTGGTLDKLESISGFKVDLSRARFEEIISKVGCAVIGQSKDIAPSDRKLYSLRDVTGTVECIPLIVASILSKKAVEGAQGLVLDVKVGSGALMKTMPTARKLAKTLTRVSKKLGLPARAVVTNMYQPLGHAVGNALEVRESIEVLTNSKATCEGAPSTDFKELTLRLCADMLTLGKVTKTLAEGRKLAAKKLASGEAWDHFKKLVKEQGGSEKQVEDVAKLPISSKVVQWKAPKNGYVLKMNALTIGRMLVELGGGRKRTSDQVDPSVGFVFRKKLGARVKAGEPIVDVYCSKNSDSGDIDEMEQRFLKSLEISSNRRPVPQLVLDSGIK